MSIEIFLVKKIKAKMQFVFDWWTDLSPDDSKLVKPLKKREIISKESNLIVLRDEEEMYFKRMTFSVKVYLEKPNHWISEYDGKVAKARSEYILEEVEDSRSTLLRYHTKIEPNGYLTRIFSPFVKPFIKRIFASEMSAFIRKLEEDYQSSSRLED
jgi:hypothetical protein